MATCNNQNGEGSKSVDVVVVGAGMSGLVAAYEILKADKSCNIVVLEAKDRIGGRLESVKLPAANGEDVWDVGGQWVGTGQKDIIQLLQELDIEIYPQWFGGQKILKLGNGKSYKYNDYPSLNYIALIDLSSLSSKLEKLAKSVPYDDPTKCAHADEWDGMTLETWLRKNSYTKATMEIMEAAIGVTFAVTPSQISLLSFLHTINCCGGWDEMSENGKSGGAQEFKVKGSAHNIVITVAERVGMDKIHLGQPVVSIEQNSDGAVVSTMNGSKYEAKYVILAIPPRFSGRIHYSPRLPCERQRLFENMIPGHLIKFIVSYSTPFWRAKQLSGESVHITGKKQHEADPVAATFDGTTNNGNPAIVGFIVSYAASKWSDRPDEEKRRAIIQSLVSYFGPEAENPLGFVVKDWSQEQWNGACPGDVISPGAYVNYYNSSLEQPFQRVHWAGTETSDDHPGYISGAVNSGKRAASQVLSRLKTNQ